MADPEVDHGFLYDVHERIDVLRSPYFDPYPGWNLTVGGYLNWIRYQLAWAVEDLLPTGRWTIIGRRPPLPPPPPPSLSLRISVCTPEGLVMPTADHRPSLAAIPIPSTTLHPTSPSRLPLHQSPPGKPCMGDPDVDHGFLYYDQGRVDLLGSPFFDVEFGNDRTADEYVDRIIYQLSLAIEDRIPPGRWYIVGPPPISPDPATSPAATTIRATDTQGELTDFRRQTGERLDNIERFGNPAIYTPSRPHSPYGEDTRNEFGPPRKPYPAIPIPSTTLHPTSPSRLPLHQSPPGKPCMGDPDIDHGFLYDDQGRVDLLGSPFFDVEFGNDRTADKYVDRIIYQLSLAIEDRIPPGRWNIVGAPPTSPDPATSPAATTIRATCLLVASLSLLAIFLR
ncbi:hypothetical protein M5K25_007211 [Dendrobium thyrsiflorum]|uniref:Uncharacterized protein n=1 Tax=Dendrobium thyrsiflorum TaxID=117978 RepID=A0ABD0VKL6_DENTH